MKVSCESCKASFKVKGEVAPGKQFKFKCPKCGFLNRLKSEDGAVEPVARYVNCEDCGAQIIEPPEGEPKACDQCRASRAVKEAQKLRAQAEESPLPEGVEFNDDVFGTDEQPAPAEEIAMPAEIELPPQPEESLKEPEIAEAAPPEPEPEPAPAQEPELASEPEPISEPEPEPPVAAKAAELPLDDEAAPDLISPPSEPELKEPAPTEAESPFKEEVAEAAEKPEPLEKEEEDEEVMIGGPPQKPATPDSTYRVRSSDGLIIGPIKLTTLRDLIKARKVNSEEDFSRDEGQWMNMADLPELFELFQSQSVLKAAKEDVEVVGEDLSRVTMSKDKILSMLKVKKNCVGCGDEIFVIEEIANPLCDQCRIEAMVAKKKKTEQGAEAMYRIRSPDGLVLGPLRLSTVEDLVAAKNIRGVEEVSVSGGPWQPIIEVDELADMFEPLSEDVIDLTETVDG